MSSIIKNNSKHMVLIVTTMVLGLLIIILSIYHGRRLYAVKDAFHQSGTFSRTLVLKASRTILLLLSAILMGTLVWVIVSMAIPKGTYLYTFFNNQYVIITIGVLLWILVPVQLLISDKGATEILTKRKTTLFNLKYVMGLITTWILFAGIIGIILWKVVGNKETISDYFIQGTGIASLIVFSGVFFNLSWVLDYKVRRDEIRPSESDQLWDRYDPSRPRHVPGRDDSVLSLSNLEEFQFDDGTIVDDDDEPFSGGKIGRRRHRQKK